MKTKVSWGLFLVLLTVLLLRFPSFFEPYWYGDEGIYLAIGQALDRGAVLYRDIWDNKTPLLYLIYALHPTLLFAKASATIFVLMSCLGIYLLAGKIFRPDKKTRVVSLAVTLAAGLLFSLPLLEGTIANAELYFTLFTVWGAYLIYTRLLNTVNYRPIALAVGLLASLAFLLKVPAVLDFVGLTLAWLFLRLAKLERLNATRLLRALGSSFPVLILVGIGFLVPILGFIAYFYSAHALSDFFTAAFAQNASYVAIDSGPFSRLENPLIVRGVLLAAFSAGIFYLFLRRRVTRELVLLTLWTAFSLYGSLLSNRPYLHYLLQVVPPMTLLLGYLLQNLRRFWLWLLGIIATGWFTGQLFLHAFFLPPVPYYQNFLDYLLGKKSWEAYVTAFDPRTLNNYLVADFLKLTTRPTDPLFVWGDASFFYVLSGRPPATKFIQAHHLTTIDPVNYRRIITRLTLLKPKYILVARPATFPFPALEQLLEKNYQLTAVFSNIFAYRLLPDR